MSKPIDMRFTRVRQRGISLIELLVGITIGMLVVLAATGTIVLNRVAGNTVSDTAAVTSQASNAMRQMAFILRQAGAIELEPTSTAAPAAEQVFNLGSMNRAFLATAAAPGVSQELILGTNGSGTGVNSDTLTVRYANRDSTVTRDCLGATTAGLNLPITNVFNIALSSGKPNLTCQGEPMAQNIEDLQVLYLTESGAGWQWMNATQVAAAASWNRVVAAQICLQVRGDINHGTALVGNYTNCANTQTAHDRFYRLVVRQTVQLRNRMNNL